jgi:DNA gyrase subunit A
LSARVVEEGDEAMLITDRGTMIRTRVKEISVISRNTQGVRLIELSEGEHLAGLEKIVESETL